MLTLTRKRGEKIQIADNITITVKKIGRKEVSIGIDAPREIRVVRGELRRSPLDEVQATENDKEQSDGANPNN